MSCPRLQADFLNSAWGLHETGKAGNRGIAPMDGSNRVGLLSDAGLPVGERGQDPRASLGRSQFADALRQKANRRIFPSGISVKWRRQWTERKNANSSRT